ncbi:MAG: hypothetical protein DRJ97_00865 [Thermoprotei archaeon]|nr:MAG: hypothetical protein DRJ97_00865 [Thermoprotei archaeon]
MVKAKKTKFVKVVKRRLPWLEHLIEREDVARDLNLEDTLATRVPRGSLCVYCKASKMLCGKPSCPILVKLRCYIKVEPSLRGLSVEGSSPPAVFVGRRGYPYVNVGPLVPPMRGDTSLYDSPERWLEANVSLEDVVDMRMKLVRGKVKARVDEADEPRGVLQTLQEMVLSSRPVDAEMQLKRRPLASLILDDDVQPIGPSAPMEELRVEAVNTYRLLEKVYGDVDLKAEEAILELYRRGTPVTYIQRALSVGMMGLKGRRKLVPTRWSITAVDSIVSRRLIDEVVKRSEEVAEFRVYSLTVMGNEFIVLMIPGKWSYESIEAWYPGTAWNPDQESLAFCGDWEGYWGRSSYASMGGCYYAARLAVAEALAREHRQAQVLVLREARPGYIMPVGVWIVREAVREALRRKPEVFDTAQEALEHAFKRLMIRPEEWFKVSWTLDSLVKQEKITKYLERKA